MFEQKRAYWRSLDNAAKLFSAASSPKDTRVFRFYCELKKEVEGNALQEALDQTIEKYPVFLSVMRKGLFWHYLEKSELRPIVRKEYKEPCSSLYVRDKKTLLFEVTYYKKRINFEVFHALTDGTGATEFLRELVKNYLHLVHKEELEPVELSDQYLTVKDQEDDSFSRYYDPDFPRKKKKKSKAFQIKKNGKGYEELQVNEATVPVKELLGISREKGVSMSVLLTTAFICAIHEEMSRIQEKKPVILMVPVNLRKIFPSDSMLNFFGYIEPGYQFGEEKDSFEDVLEAVKIYFRENLSKEHMAGRMNELIAIEKHKILKWAPLELKNRCIRAGAKMAEQEVTAVLSNMSVVKMPEDYADYIEKFGVYTSTNRTELCICSFKDTLSLSFTSRYDSTNIQRNFYRILKELGVQVTVTEADFPKDAKANYEGKKVLQIFTFCCIAAIVISMMTDIIISPGGTLVSICSGWLCNDVVYDGSCVCEAFQSVEERGVAASDHVRYLRVMGSGNRMEGMVGKYRNPGYLPIDPDCNADHIPNTVIIAKRVYDILCNGVGIFDDTAVHTAHHRCGPLQNSVCHLYRL